MLANLAIFTDLDGTLLNHHDYNFEAAKSTLAALNANGIPVVFNTSKTASELINIRTETFNTSPFICENGAAVYLPTSGFTEKPDGCEALEHYWRKSFVQPRSHWQALINSVDEDLTSCFQTFAQLGTQGIIEATGLPRDKAEQANQREFNEPVLWQGSEHDKHRFIQQLEAKGATLLQGGRFLHVGGNCDKASAMLWLADQFAALRQVPIQTIALGDGGNDVAMLNAADFAVAVKSASNQYPQLQRASATYLTQNHAPEAWPEGIQAALQYFTVTLKQ